MKYKPFASIYFNHSRKDLNLIRFTWTAFSHSTPESPDQCLQAVSVKSEEELEDPTRCDGVVDKVARHRSTQVS